MVDMPRFRPVDLGLLLLVVALAAGTRAGYLVGCCDGGRTAGPLRVQDASPAVPGAHPEDGRGAPQPSELDQLIEGVQSGNWFGTHAPFAAGEEATAHVSPGYPYLVGLLGRLVGDEALDLLVRWGQVGLGALTAALYFFFARRAFRSRAVGAAAGLLAALHPFWIVNVASVDDGTLAAFALAGCLFLAGQAAEKGGVLTSLLFGLALAGASLVRAALLPFAFVTLCWFLLGTRFLARGWLCALLAFLGFANGLAPWTVRNYQLFHEPVPVVSSVYLHLWIGSNPQATGGPPTPAMWQTAPSAGLKSIDSQPLRYAQLAPHVAQEWRQRPGATVQRRLAAAFYFLCGARWFADGTLAERTTSAEELPDWLAGYDVTLQAMLLAMLALAFLGWRWSASWHQGMMPATLALLCVPLPYLLGHADALSGPRLPLDGVFLLLAAVAVCRLLPGTGPALAAGPEVTPPPAA